MDKKQIIKVVEKAAKILKDYPEMTYKQAIDKAKEINKGEKSCS